MTQTYAKRSNALEIHPNWTTVTRAICLYFVEIKTFLKQNMMKLKTKADGIRFVAVK